MKKTKKTSTITEYDDVAHYDSTVTTETQPIHTMSRERQFRKQEAIEQNEGDVFPTEVSGNLLETIFVSYFSSFTVNSCLNLTSKTMSHNVNCGSRLRQSTREDELKK